MERFRLAAVSFLVLALAWSVALPQIGGATSVKDSPGYYYVPDPESMSVVIGRRTNAPLVSQPFYGGARSMDELGKAVCWTLNHTSGDSLLKLCVTDMEFKNILWREFPQSRPATGLLWDDAWKILYARLHAGCAHAIRDYGGHYLQFVRFEPAESLGVYKNFKLHSHLVLVAKDDTGELQRMHWLRSVAERKGKFKIYSTED